MVTHEQWLAAQLAERKHHTFSFEEGFAHYQDSYRQYLEHTGGSFDLGGRSITEIGPGDFSGVMYCHNYSGAFIYETMPSEILSNWVGAELGIPVNDPMPGEILSDWEKEHMSRTKKGGLCSNPIHLKTPMIYYCRPVEVWLFNVLQHVEDPELIVKWSKQADIIRFFEPINCGTDECHLHNLTLEMFQEWFGDCVKYYPANPGAKNFHTAECAYGCWTRKEKIANCPFCGSGNVSQREQELVAGHHSFSYEVFVQCQDCKAKGPHLEGWDSSSEVQRKEAIKLWNERI